MPTASMPCRRIWLAAIHFQCRHDRESELLTHEATARRIITLFAFGEIRAIHERKPRWKLLFFIAMRALRAIALDAITYRMRTIASAHALPRHLSSASRFKRTFLTPLLAFSLQIIAAPNNAPFNRRCMRNRNVATRRQLRFHVLKGFARAWSYHCKPAIFSFVW